MPWWRWLRCTRLTFISVFFNVAFAAAAQAHFNGTRISVGEALGEAWQRLGKIALWALLSAGVGFVLSEISARIPGAGRVVSWLLGTAWGVATIFAIPLLAIEDAGPVEALRGSGHLIKSGIGGEGDRRRWSGLEPGLVLVAMPAGIVLAAGAGASSRHPESGIPLIVIGACALVVVSALATATRQVFAVALFRYATDVPVGGFPTADLKYPFVPKARRRGAEHTGLPGPPSPLSVSCSSPRLSSVAANPSPTPEGTRMCTSKLPRPPSRQSAMGCRSSTAGNGSARSSTTKSKEPRSTSASTSSPSSATCPALPGIELNYQRPNHPYLLLWDNGKH